MDLQELQKKKDLALTTVYFTNDSTGIPGVCILKVASYSCLFSYHCIVTTDTYSNYIWLPEPPLKNCTSLRKIPPS